MSPTVNDGTKPVPPYNAVIAVADQVPLTIVPTEVKEELVTPVPKDVEDSTEVPLIL